MKLELRVNALESLRKFEILSKRETFQQSRDYRISETPPIPAEPIITKYKKIRGYLMKEPVKISTLNQQKPGPRADKADGESAVLAEIAAMPEPDRAIGERLHAIIKASAPALSPRLWYGMPAYARDGKVVCFFQSAHKFKTRYATFGFMRRGEPRRRRHVADSLRAEGVDCRRRGKDRRPREESGELRTELAPDTGQ